MSSLNAKKVWGRLRSGADVDVFLRRKKKVKKLLPGTIYDQITSQDFSKLDKQEDEYINIIPNHDDDGWWKDVQTFDFGVQIDKENRVANRFAEVTEDEIRAMSKKKNAARTDDATKSGMKFS